MAIRKRVEFFRIDQEPVNKWYNSSFRMADKIKNEEPKQMKEEAHKVYLNSFWDFPGSPQYDNDITSK